MYSSDDEPKKTKGKSRRELPTGAVATLKAWLLSPEHFTHPYPTPQDQIILMQKTGIDKKQLKNWFTNARRRIWKPMLKKQLEAGKLAATSGGGGGLSQQGGGLNNQQEQVVSSAPPPQLEMYNNYQQATTVTQGSDEYEYGQQQPQYDNGGYGYDSQQQYQQDTTTQQQQQQQPEQFPNCNSIGSLAPLNPNGLSSISSFGRMFKTDSHAVLMELFARDQDLVKQASGQKGGMIQAAAVGNTTSVGSGMTNGISSASMAREINKEMMNNSATNAAGSLLSSAAAASSSSSTTGNLRSTYNNNNSSSGSPQQQKVTFGNTNQTSSTVPSLSSWPHFSSVSSLNNMGNGGSSLGLKGVKSITNLSAADLSSQGNLNKMGNLAHVKSIENMGRGDSFAFLEVFFDDKSGLASSSGNVGGGGGGGQRGVKREREEDDNAIGLSLDGDDGTTPDTKPPAAAPQPPNPAVPTPAPLPENGVDIAGEGGEVENSENLKRAYDDALAARGLIAVRRSCEKLTDLDLPNKMQRTLSQEYIRQHNQGQPMGDFFSSNNSSFAPNRSPQAAQQAAINTSVEVPSSTKCALCSRNLVDTQLRPCGHMFHGRCLKPSLSGGPPQCPICSVPMQSAILAVPATDNNAGVAMGLTLEG